MQLPVRQGQVAGVRQYQHFIDGTWQAGGGAEVYERANPATGEPVARFALGDVGDIDRAVSAARGAFEAGPWPRLRAEERAGILYRWADLMEAEVARLVEIEIAEVGKPRRFVEADVATAIALTRHAAAMAAQSHGQAFRNLDPAKTGLVLREPAGVAGIIIPWNFPIEIFAKKVPFALAAGCCVVVKPSELTSGSALEAARLAAEAGLPAGVLNVVTGTGKDAGDPLTRHAGVDMVSFTGSTAVGQAIIRNSADPIKRVCLELGGKSANIVCDDADLESALEGTLKAIFAFQGQCCVAGARLLVADAIAKPFTDALCARAAALRIGNPSEDATDIGSMISEQQLERVVGFIGRAEAGGSRLVAGGGPVSPGAGLTGNFLPPTIFDAVLPQSELFAEEVFGPVLAITRFRDLDEAIRLANATRYGLANTIWTRSLETAMTASRQLQSGVVWVNTTLDGAPQLPFGGVKASGYGRELGTAGFDEFTQIKTVLLSTMPFAPAFRAGSAVPVMGGAGRGQA